MGGGRSCHPTIACTPHSPAPSPAGSRTQHFVESPTTGDTARAEIQTRKRAIVQLLHVCSAGLSYDPKQELL